MNIFGKTLASFGIGATKVDTRLEKANYSQGETIRGEVFIQGGQAQQEIDDIYLFLVVQYEHEGTQAEYVISEFRISERFEMGPKETKVIPFEFDLPYDSPVSTSGSPIYIKTGLDIKMAVDPTDHDGIEVVPHPFVQQVVKATEYLGYRLEKVDMDFEHYYSRHPFVQQYQFKPTGNTFSKYIDDIQMVFFPFQHELDIILRVDRKAIGLMSSMEEALNLDEKISRFTITYDEVKDNISLLESKIEYQIQRQIQT